MAIIGALSRHRHFDEFNEPLDTGTGWLSPSARKALARANIGAGDGTPPTADAVLTANALTSTGAQITIPAGSSLEAALQIIMDFVDSGA